MGGGARKDRLRCIKCYKEHEYDRIRTGDIHYRNVHAIARKGDSIILKCNSCGHVYTSKSKAAYREWKEVMQTAKDISEIKNKETAQ